MVPGLYSTKRPIAKNLIVLIAEICSTMALENRNVEKNGDRGTVLLSP